MSLVQSLVELAQQSGAKDLPVCEKAVVDASTEQRSMVNALLETGQVDEKVFAHKLGESLGLPVWDGEIPPIPAPLREKFPARIALRHRLLPVTPAEGAPLPVLCFDPFDHVARQALAGFWGGDTQWVLAPRRAVLDGLRGGYGVGAETFDEILEAGGEFAASNDLEQETTIMDEKACEASVSQVVNPIIREGFEGRRPGFLT